MTNIYRNPASSYLTVYVETASGFFSTEVSTNANVSVETSGSSQVAAAVPISTGRYCSGWTNGGTVTAYGISTRTNSSSLVAYPSVANGSGIAVTVTDEHGTHSGTVTGSYRANCAIGVKHLTTDSGYTFKGWKVTRAAATSAAGTILSTGGTDASAVTTFPADYGAAVVMQLGSSSSYPVTIEAVYEVASSNYTVAFNKVSSDVTGDDIPDITVAVGAAVILPAAELWQREGFDFGGWSSTSGGAAEYQAGDSYTPTGNVTLYAVWNSTGGSGARPNVRSETRSLGRTSYTDKYYFNLSSNVATGALSVSYMTRAFGSWINNQYTYSPQLNPNPTVTTTIERSQGSESTETASVPAGSSASSGTPNGVEFNVPGDYISYYDYYRSNNSSQYYTANDTTRVTSIGSAWTWTAPELENYEFDGWYTLAQSWDQAHTPTNGEFTVKVSGSRTVAFSDILSRTNPVCRSSGSTGSASWHYYTNYLQARYTGVQVLVLFDAQGGALDDFYRVVRFGQAYGSLPTPTRTGYQFAGWYTAASGGTEIISSTVNETGAQHTLYAHWTATAGSYNLYFDAAGGTCSETVRTVTEGSAYGTLPTPIRSGYSFIGWFTSGGTEVTAATVAGGCDAVIYARWRGADCTVTFDANGGTCSEATRTVYVGATVGSLPTATKSGCKFAGWFTVGGTQALASTVISSSITLTARWEAESSSRVIVRYRIKLTLNGGTLDSSYECKYTRGFAKALPTSAEVTRSGYTFGGWYPTADFTGTPSTEIPTSASGTKSFYAKWN